MSEHSAESDEAPLSLTDFLLARIAEDEYNARDGSGYLAVRVKLDSEAKRRIVGYHLEAIAEGVHADERWPYEDVLYPLAAAYADHPDFREEWRTDAPVSSGHLVVVASVASDHECQEDRCQMCGWMVERVGHDPRFVACHIPPDCEHDWFCRPESDTWECGLCGSVG